MQRLKDLVHLLNVWPTSAAAWWSTTTWHAAWHTAWHATHAAITASTMHLGHDRVAQRLQLLLLVAKLLLFSQLFCSSHDRALSTASSMVFLSSGLILSLSFSS